MYPKKDTRLHDETIRRHSNAVIGILIISLTIIFGLSVLGVWGVENTKNGIHEEDDELPFVPENKSTEDKISKQTSLENNSKNVSSEIHTSEVESSEILIAEDNLSETVISMGSSDVSVLDCMCKDHIDTVPGSITFDGECPILESDPLPLCITQDDLNDCNLTATVVGGYDFLWGKIKIYQNKQEGCGPVGCINIELIPINPDAPCCVPKVYDVVLTLCDGPICLQSNNMPEMGDDWNITPGSPDGKLDKWVKICVVTKWEGCPLEEQEFLAILAHKAMSQNPRLSMRDTSSS
ncbi:MAG: hypothetical protein ACFFAN_10325 [Promethearchaeota archaeon]